MKDKLFTTLLALLFTAALSAQGTKSGGDDISYTGFTFNYAYQDVHTNVDDLKAVWNGKDDNLAHGFNTGFYVQQNLYKGMVIVTGFQYQFTMRVNRDVNLISYTLPGKGDIQYFNHNLIVPIKFGYSFKFGGTSCFTAFAGPSLNFLVSTMENLRVNRNNYIYTDYVNGKHTVKTEGSKTTETSSDHKRMTWFDIPMGLGAVVKFGRFGIHFEYEWGLCDRWKNSGKFRTDQMTAGLVISF
ncbi:MAG: hypothetical protein MJ002_08455 [Paludibacteraceae bacterium]|nr:hypothetical protein [Paludibacteraceae bacterium]